MRTSIKFFLHVLLVLIFAYCLQSAVAEPVVLNGIAAVINDDIITQDELGLQVKLAKQQMQAQKIPMPAAKALEGQVLELMINQALQLQMARRAHFMVTDEELQEGLSQMAASQNLSVDQFFKAVESQGIAMEVFRQQFRDQLLVSKLQKALIAPQIKISPAQIDTYFRSVKKQNQGMQYHLEDRLFSLPSAPTPEQVRVAMEKAKQFIAKIKAGADFKTLVQAESPTQNALTGGDLGWHSLAELPAAFSGAVQNLEVGQVSSPVRSLDGIHVLSLVGVRSGGLSADPEQNKQEIANMLFRRQFEERLAIWLEQARETAYIQILIEVPGEEH